MGGRRRMSKTQKRRSRKTGFASVGIIVVIFLAIMGIQIFRLNQKLAEKEEQLQLLQEQYEEETQRTSELEELEAYMQSDEYIEEMAKSKLGLVYDDEIIFKESEE